VQVESFLDEYKNDVVVVDFRAFQKKTVFTAFDPKGAGDVAHIDVDVETEFMTFIVDYFRDKMDRLVPASEWIKPTKTVGELIKDNRRLALLTTSERQTDLQTYLLSRKSHRRQLPREGDSGRSGASPQRDMPQTLPPGSRRLAPLRRIPVSM